ncbi:MAG: PIG-L family deacetylase [Spirochaetales bacterium]|nr:PIG-L family deacetylase [Spirochaetales bacterium]
MIQCAPVELRALTTGIACIGSVSVAIIATLSVANLILFHLVNDPTVPLSSRNPDYASPRSVLAIFAHPDDEIMVAGSLVAWRKAGASIHLLYLTRGEDGPTGGLVNRDGLGDLREQELARVARLTGDASLTVLRYPDRRLDSVPLPTLQSEIAARLDSARPDTVVCFDDALGLYGHPDHAWSGRATRELLVRDRHGVRQLAVMTLCDRQIALALKVSRTFRERFRPETGLPPATLAMRIAPYGNVKKKICLAHRSQRAVIDDVQPLVTHVPAWFYYRVFSREYYNLIRLGTDRDVSMQEVSP